MHTRLDSRWVGGSGNAIGILNGNDVLVGGVTYTQWNGANIVVDIAVEAKRWCTPDILYCLFSFPFEQLGCKRMTAPIAASNKRSIKFVEHLGFTLEATLKDACKDGDMLLYSMTKEKCRWLTRPQVLPRILNNG